MCAPRPLEWAGGWVGGNRGGSVSGSARGKRGQQFARELRQGVLGLGPCPPRRQPKARAHHVLWPPVRHGVGSVDARWRGHLQGPVVCVGGGHVGAHVSGKGGSRSASPAAAPPPPTPPTTHLSPPLALVLHRFSDHRLGQQLRSRVGWARARKQRRTLNGNAAPRWLPAAHPAHTGAPLVRCQRLGPSRPSPPPPRPAHPQRSGLPCARGLLPVEGPG